MFFLVGIKGSGMSALALILNDLGYEVAGSDEFTHYFTEDKLRAKKIPIYPFSKDNIKEGYIYIIGNAFGDEMAEVAEIKRAGFKYYYYHQFVGEFFSGKKIAVSGTHGKTTTTSLLKSMLSTKKICYLIGDGNGAGSPGYEYFIFEACEYKNHFLAYNPDLLIITNIELDHVDFFKNIKEVYHSFQKLAQKAKVVIVNGDDKYAAKIKHHHLISFGFKKRCDARIEIVDENADGYIIIIYYRSEKYRFILPFTGLHMVYNFTASFLASLICCATLDDVTNSIPIIKLPKRRTNITHYGEAILVDDYAHHPTEMKATLEGLKQKYQGYPMKVIFQSHTYSRTLFFKRELVRTLKLFDEAYVDHVFSSKREMGKEYLQQKVEKAFKKIPSFNADTLRRINKDEKVVWIFMGAGTVNEYLKLLNIDNEKE